MTKGNWQKTNIVPDAGFSGGFSHLITRRSRYFRVLLWLPAFSFLVLFFFYPLGRILSLSLDISALSQAQALSVTTRALTFTFYQAVLSTFLTLVLGLPAAFLFARFKFSGKVFLRTLTAIPFMLPTVVVAAGFNAWLGPRGWLNILLMTIFGLSSPPITLVGTLAAILAAHVFYNTTIVIRVVSNALSLLDPRLEQAARTLGANGWQVFWHVILPLLRPYLLAASLLVFLFDFTSFGVILLLGGPQFATLEVEIYLQAMHYFNLPLAAWLSLIQLLCTLIFSTLYSHLISGTLTVTAPRQVAMMPPCSLRARLFTIVMAGLLFAFYFLPLISLPLRSLTRLEAERGQRGEVQYGLTTNYYTELFLNRRGSAFYIPPVQALGNSLGYAALTVILSLTLGLPTALALTRPGKIEQVLDPLLMLPLGASAVTLGLGFVLAFNTPLFNYSLLTSPILVPLAHTIIALPFVVRTLQPALASIPVSLRQAAATLGASPVRAWREVDWPIIRRATLAAGVFAFTISMGEFGAATLVARPEYPTLPLAIYRFLSQPGGLNYGQAMAMSTILMLVTGMGILIIEKLRLPGTTEF